MFENIHVICTCSAMFKTSKKCYISANFLSKNIYVCEKLTKIILNNIREIKRLRCPLYPLFLATLAAFSIGTYLDIVRFAALQKHITINQRSRGLLTLLGAIPVVISTKLLADKIGRKTTIWLATVPLFFCWHIIGYIKSKAW